MVGFTVAVATDRRRHPVADLFEDVGARTMNVQAVRPMAQPSVEAVRVANMACLARPINEVVVGSVFGLRSWLQLTRQLGQFDAMVAPLEQARLLAYDARVAGALRELG